MVAEEITKAAARHIREQNERLRIMQSVCIGQTIVLALVLGVVFAVHEKREKLRD